MIKKTASSTASFFDILFRGIAILGQWSEVMMHCFIFVSRIDDAEIVNAVISPTSKLAFTMGIDIITGGF